MKPSIFSGMSDSVKQTQLNFAAPVLQENADTLSGDERFAQLESLYDNNAAKGGSKQAQQEAENLNAYQQKPRDMMEEHAKRLANLAPPPKGLVEQIPLWGWVLIGVAGWRMLTRR